MRGSIANLKENLNRMALEIHDDDENDAALSLYRNSGDRAQNSSVTPADRRISRNFSPSKSLTHRHSPIANGFDSAYENEILKNKADVKRLQQSEAEVKELSVVYDALLKEKEDEMSRLNEETISLIPNLETSFVLNASRNVLNGNSCQSSGQQHKPIVKSYSIGSPANILDSPGHDVFNNGTLWCSDNELVDFMEGKNRSLVSTQTVYELRLKQLRMELDKKCRKMAIIVNKLQEEQKLNASFEQELNSLKVGNDNMTLELKRIHDELNQKTSEIQQLQMELHTRDNEETNELMATNLRRVIVTLQNENSTLKTEKEKLEAALIASQLSPGQTSLPGGNETQSPPVFPKQEEMEKLLQKLEIDLNEMRKERDKALQELNRLKQHLLEKESEESEKMDEDGKLIEQLQQNNEHLRAQVLHLETALKQSATSQEEVKSSIDNELKKAKETIDELNGKLASRLSVIEAKNIEILNLQTALGQYYAELEAKERLGEKLTTAKEELTRLSGLLKDSHQQSETLKREKVEVLAKLSDAERKLSERKSRLNKLEQDNEKLSRALEQSMTRLNRMSLDSDNYVDRRIVIKLLVTYFQRNHSKEVLDLLARMLGFSDEEKQRIGIAQQGSGKGVIRGVLGLPGRLVGGIFGGGSITSNMNPNNQICGLIFFLKRLKKEREGRLLKNTREMNKVRMFLLPWNIDQMLLLHPYHLHYK
ncbi:golgin candidate 4-like isoform X3 [Ipomoea triloba]|uniref:golgin candidate 4-like isoform X3 n=1 Tax=Ipomoea triloba TaxID=35885 RepID=UPI00125CD939|nr:golgin candidate 4-like isoform X3 [Ipomoea triloba]